MGQAGQGNWSGAAQKVSNLIAASQMAIIYFRPQGLIKQADRDAAVQRCRNHFAYMHALRKNVTYITTNCLCDSLLHASDQSVIAADLALWPTSPSKIEG